MSSTPLTRLVSYLISCMLPEGVGRYGDSVYDRVYYRTRDNADVYPHEILPIEAQNI